MGSGAAAVSPLSCGKRGCVPVSEWEREDLVTSPDDETDAESVPRNASRTSDALSTTTPQRWHALGGAPGSSTHTPCTTSSPEAILSFECFFTSFLPFFHCSLISNFIHCCAFLVNQAGDSVAPGRLPHRRTHSLAHTHSSSTTRAVVRTFTAEQTRRHYACWIDFQNCGLLISSLRLECLSGQACSSDPSVTDRTKRLSGVSLRQQYEHSTICTSTTVYRVV